MIRLLEGFTRSSPVMIAEDINMRFTHKPSHTHLQPGMLVKPNPMQWDGYVAPCRGIHEDKLDVNAVDRYYNWSENQTGLIVKKVPRKNSLYADIYVLIDDRVVVFSAEHVKPI
jgi:hypothetical protein